MIITSSRKVQLDENRIDTSFEFDGSEYRVFHAQEISPILKQNKELKIDKEDTNGFSKERTMRKIASIPALIFVQHPEFHHDDKALMKWLRSEEGRPYLTVSNVNRGKTKFI